MSPEDDQLTVEKAPAAAPSTDADWAYSKQYFDLTEQGHTRPTPRLGAPCAHWHLAVWPRTDVDPNDFKERCEDGAALDGSQADRLEKFKRIREERLRARAEHLTALIARMKRRGAIQTGAGAPEAIRRVKSTVQADAMRNDVESVCFTLWWGGGATLQPVVDAAWRPNKAAIRVRVHVEHYEEYFTVAFFMDFGKAWSAAPAFTADEAGARDQGDRRRALFQAIESVQGLCEPRIRDAVVDRDLTPESGIDAAASQTLRDAADHLYDTLWDDFCAAFDISEAVIAGDAGRIFANFRGVVLASAGADLAADETPIALTGATLAGSEARGRGDDWLPSFDIENGEANAVLKAYWPFIRRTSFGADYRDWIACSIFGRRSLYATALGSLSLQDGAEEGLPEYDVPVGTGSLPAPHRWAPGDIPEDDRRPRSVYLDRPGPFRELYITKLQPHPAQLGRMLERFNRLGTLRLYALKNAAIIRDAGSLVRIAGQQLNAVMSDWHKKIDDLSKQRDPFVRKEGPLEDEDRDEKADLDRRMALENTRAEHKLVEIGIDLNELGRDAVGGLEYRINRSRRHADLFRRFVSTMDIGTIPTWMSYEEFAVFGLEGVFEEIDRVGDRVDGLRHRLQNSMTSIQTGSIAGQTEATRDNTMYLERISNKILAVETQSKHLLRAIKEINTRSARIQCTAAWVSAGVWIFLFFAGANTFSQLTGWKLDTKNWSFVNTLEGSERQASDPGVAPSQNRASDN